MFFWILLTIKFGTLIPFVYYYTKEWRGKSVLGDKDVERTWGTLYFLSCMSLMVYILIKILD